MDMEVRMERILQLLGMEVVKNHLLQEQVAALAKKLADMQLPKEEGKQ